MDEFFDPLGKLVKIFSRKSRVASRESEASTMDFQPKPITKEGVPAALQKAERYRVINDPTSAESICLDVLTVSPDNQQALVTLLLAITDQFGEAPTEGVRRARGRSCPGCRTSTSARTTPESSASDAPRPSFGRGCPESGRDGLPLAPGCDGLVREGGVPAAAG